MNLSPRTGAYHVHVKCEVAHYPSNANESDALSLHGVPYFRQTNSRLPIMVYINI